MRRRFVFAGLAVAGLAAAAGVAFQLGSGGEPGSAGEGAGFGSALDLVDHGGRRFTGRDLHGKPTAVFVGFTYCPDVCPTTLSRLSAALGEMGEAADKLNVLFLSIDPQRDTPAGLKAYMGSFSPRIRALTGDPDHIHAAADALGATYKPVLLDEGGYTMAHSADIFLVNRGGQVVGRIGPAESVDQSVVKLKALAGATG